MSAGRRKPDYMFLMMFNIFPSECGSRNRPRWHIEAPCYRYSTLLDRYLHIIRQPETHESISFVGSQRRWNSKMLPRCSGFMTQTTRNLVHWLQMLSTYHNWYGTCLISSFEIYWLFARLSTMTVSSKMHQKCNGSKTWMTRNPVFLHRLKR